MWEHYLKHTVQTHIHILHIFGFQQHYFLTYSNMTYHCDSMYTCFAYLQQYIPISLDVLVVHRVGISLFVSICTVDTSEAKTPACGDENRPSELQYNISQPSRWAPTSYKKLYNCPSVGITTPVAHL